MTVIRESIKVIEIGLIFDEDVDFFSEKIILCAKGGDFKKGALDSDFMFVNIEPYKSKKCVPY